MVGEALQILMGKFTVPEPVTSATAVGDDFSDRARVPRLRPSSDRHRRARSPCSKNFSPSEARDSNRRCNRSHSIRRLPASTACLRSIEAAIDLNAPSHYRVCGCRGWIIVEWFCWFRVKGGDATGVTEKREEIGHPHGGYRL